MSKNVELGAVVDGMFSQGVVHLEATRTPSEPRSGMFAAGVSLLIPGALRALRFRQVAVLHAIIDVAIADAAQGLVIKAGLTAGFAQLFAELVQGLEVVGGGGNLGLGSLEEFLVALIDEAGDFTADQNAGLGEEAHAAVLSFFNRSGTGVFLQEHAVLSSGSFQNLESVVAQPVHRVFISWFLSFLCHYPT